MSTHNTRGQQGVKSVPSVSKHVGARPQTKLGLKTQYTLCHCLWWEGNTHTHTHYTHARTHIHTGGGNFRQQENEEEVLLPPQLLISVRNSSRVFGSSLKTPNMVLVTVLLFIFWTPRITMHMWVASMTTPTPVGCRASVIATAICLVNLSWTCSRRL